jgi:aryl-alcohol dehydrogenase-like predicted oxidoreductase
MTMSGAEQSGTFALGNRQVRRLGFGAMQLSGSGVFGPPKDRAAALAVLREAVALGVNHIDTSDYYGPHVTNQLIHEALHPYPDDLVIVTKVGARRGTDGSVLAASSPSELIGAVHDNLRNLVSFSTSSTFSTCSVSTKGPWIRSKPSACLTTRSPH